LQGPAGQGIYEACAVIADLRQLEPEHPCEVGDFVRFPTGCDGHRYSFRGPLYGFRDDRRAPVVRVDQGAVEIDQNAGWLEHGRG
jgi:hypothetical protein